MPLKPSITLHRRFAVRASPLAVFEALYASDAHAFLYESLENDGARGRYSFVGGRPRAIFRAKGQDWKLTGRNGERIDQGSGDPLAAVRELCRQREGVPPVAPLPAGAVGYFGYDAIRWIERVPDTKPDVVGAPDAILLFPGEIVCFDHVDQVVHVVLDLPDGHETRMNQIASALTSCEKSSSREDSGPDRDSTSKTGLPAGLTPNMSREQFFEMVGRAKEFILAGDIFQVVLSQRFSFPMSMTAVDLYRALRITNPSPYMYLLRLDGIDVAGSSPEVLVRLSGRRVVTRPLAGTRPRSPDALEDLRLEQELRADPKERAEHVMLVDLGRNDLGRVCDFGSVRVGRVMDVERHSRVMHLVSSVDGWLREGADALDVLRAAFPAGTVSGAPKVRAMEIIDELEPERRGVYAGAIGYLSYTGDMDLCIAIRSIVMAGGRGFIQAGAGVVADSDPQREYEETLNKARSLFQAVELARRLTQSK